MYYLFRCTYYGFRTNCFSNIGAEYRKGTAEIRSYFTSLSSYFSRNLKMILIKESLKYMA